MSTGRKILPKFLVVGHRGHGMNILQSTDKRMKVYKENSILSFNNAANHPLDFIEFDVQVIFSLLASGFLLIVYRVNSLKKSNRRVGSIL